MLEPSCFLTLSDFNAADPPHSSAINFPFAINSLLHTVLLLLSIHLSFHLPLFIVIPFCSFLINTHGSHPIPSNPTIFSYLCNNLITHMSLQIFMLHLFKLPASCLRCLIHFCIHSYPPNVLQRKRQLGQFESFQL